MPRYGHPASLVNRNKFLEVSLTNPSVSYDPTSLTYQHKIPTDLLCQQTRLAPIMSSVSIKIQINIYDQYLIPFEVKLCYSHAASLVNQNKIPIELSC